ncbi:MAG: CDP-alcohol phosphatidyltransferase family protein [Planctomycetes bacterium]|nr:CDP-alcohol phosphatidyltransferase family protein [Planctomycetota bacterium]
MGASWRELRDVCQRPVRDGNDVAGLIFGDHASLLITKVFVDLRLSPNYASIGFFMCGLIGAGLQFASGSWAAIGAVLLVLYYVLDCVDGEVARWQKVVNVHWGYFDYLFHMLIKPLAFLGVGVGTCAATGQTWPLIAAFTAAIATLWRKILIEIPGILFLKDVLKRSAGPSASDAPRSSPFQSPVAHTQSSRSVEPFRLRLNIVTLRAIATNFDIGLLLLTVATSLDALATADRGLQPMFGTIRGLWLAYYGVILPLDFLDYLVTYLRREHFSTEMTRLLSLAHHFRAHAPDQDPPLQ